MHSIKSILTESTEFYKAVKKERERSNASKHPTSNVELVRKNFDEADMDDLISQKDLCAMLRRCSWYIRRLRKEIDCAPCHQDGRYLFYRKSKVITIIEHVKNKKHRKEIDI